MRAPAPSLSPIMGTPTEAARSMILWIFSANTSPRAPPNTVKSWLNTHTLRLGMPTEPGKPEEPPPSPWAFPSAAELEAIDESEMVGVGADLAPGTLLAAYRAGLFPMPLATHGRASRQIAWWSPNPRAVLPLDGLRVSRSLRRSMRRYDVRVDTAFAAVVAECADTRR